LPGAFARQAPTRNASQFTVNTRNQLAECPVVAVPPGHEERGDVLFPRPDVRHSLGCHDVIVRSNT